MPEPKTHNPGMVVVSVATGALTNLMKFEAVEDTARLLMEREQAREELTGAATELVQCWWRSIKRIRHPRSGSKQDLFDIKTKFKVRPPLKVERSRLDQINRSQLTDSP